jgi:beta-galactosidase
VPGTFLLAVMIGVLLFPGAILAQSSLPRSRESFNQGWRFARFGPLPDGSKLPEPGGAVPTIRVTASSEETDKGNTEIALTDAAGKPIATHKPGPAASPAGVEFDDAAWRKLDVPHDWAIEGPFRDDLPNDTGKLPWQAIGWYRKHFTLPEADHGKRIFIDFDGAMANAKVWLNGEPVGGWPYGYQPFRLELTPHVRFGRENVLAVRLDTVRWGSRWYPGGGLFRNVWLVKTPPVHVGHWGVFVTTPNLEEMWGEVEVRALIENQSKAAVLPEPWLEIFELGANGPVGKPVAEAGGETGIEAKPEPITPGESGHLGLKLAVQRPKRWDLKSPNRYLARVTIKVAGRTADIYDQPFGFRRIEFTARDGFRLNGRRVELQGTCNHHDLGPLGAAFNLRAMERQMEILKEMGCNALRTSHNPPAPELAELADRIGMLVMVEAFDCWKAGKSANDYSRLFAEWHKRDLQAMVHRERNHPSVIMWSIGNEIAEEGGPELAKPLADIVRAEDSTRAVTAACNNPAAGTNGFQTAVDVFGVNYAIGSYAGILAYPGNRKKPVLSTESASTISSRGEYFFPPARGGASQADFQVSSYDLDAPGWATTPDEEFSALDHNPAFLGEFVWTGFDYLGEPTPYNGDVNHMPNFTNPVLRETAKKQLAATGRVKVPSASSYFGIVDLCGFRKDRFYAYQARWRPELPMAHIFPHWNWPERVGKVTPVHVYTSGDEAELFLNGKSLGRKHRGRFEYRLRWDDVVYAPGELRVAAYRNGTPWASDVVETTGAPAKLLLAADRKQIRADGQDLCYITVTVADSKGRLVPRTHNLVKFELAGPGQIVALGNGDAASHEPFQASQRRAFNGQCLAIVRGNPAQPGPITLRAHAAGLEDGEVVVECK